MIIIRKSAWDYDDHRGNERVVASAIASDHEARIMCDALNDAGHPDDFFVVEPDNYKLPQPWEP